MIYWKKQTAAILAVLLMIPAGAGPAMPVSAAEGAAAFSQEEAADTGTFYGDGKEAEITAGTEINGSGDAGLSDLPDSAGEEPDGGSVPGEEGELTPSDPAGGESGEGGENDNTDGGTSGEMTDPSGDGSLPGQETDPSAGELPAGEEVPSGEEISADPETAAQEAQDAAEDVSAEEEETEEEDAEEESEPVVSYRVSVSTQGWLSDVSSGKWTGSTSTSTYLEALSVSIKENEDLGIQYRVRLADSGWTGWAADGAEAGASGSGRKLEAVQIRLTGTKKNEYDVYYSLYAAGFGWMNWASGGASAGTAAIGAAARKIKICLVKKGDPAPAQISDISASYAATGVSYKGYQNGTGWLSSYVSNGAVFTGSAVLGQLRVLLKHPGCDGNIQYRVSLSGTGWQSWTSPGTSAGIKNKTIQGLQIRLTGELAAKYNVWYCVNVQGYGWLNWTSNGTTAGALSLSRGIRNIRIRILPKGVKAPANYGKFALAGFSSQKLSYSAYLPGIGWTAEYSSGKTCGKAGSNRRIEALKISLPSQKIAGSISYMGMVQDVGWESSWSRDGAVSGLEGQKKRYEAVKIKLTGEIASYYDIWYRVYVQDMGWMGWTRNGQTAGSQDLSLRMEAVQIKITGKGCAAPGSTDRPFKNGDRSAEFVKKTSRVLQLYVPMVWQKPELPTGCESVALTMALKSYGFGLEKTTIADDYLPYGFDFVTTYVGDPRTTNGQSVMAPGLVTAADNFLKAKGSKSRGHEITGTSFAGLYKQLEKGRPVIIWITSYMRQPVILNSRIYNGKTYYWYGEEHCVVLYGYDKNKGKVFIADPLSGLVTRSASAIEDIYNKSGKCAVVIY